ncbi:MAG TPA: hypothetical protein VFW19_07015 [Allosphingosinicella sp.]|nr:hypothetical protein [Allosphingosinicella sp.]
MTAEGCRTQVDGRYVTAGALPALARRWRHRLVRVETPPDPPYRCVGATIFALQQAGVARIASETPPLPAPAVSLRLDFAGGRCRYQVDGRNLDENQLRVAARRWSAVRIWAETLPDRRGGCFVAAFRILETAGVGKIGFTAEPPPAPRD